MREIKFRAWDKNLEFMVNPGYLSLDGSGLQSVFYDSCNDEESTWVNEVQDIELMQYTGLKDKNGKEIYEGDIVNHLTYGGNYPVVYSCENTGYDLKTRNGGMHLSSNCSPNLEVIGNIYESPELLEEDNGKS